MRPLGVATRASVATSTGPDALAQVGALARMQSNRSSNPRLGKQSTKPHPNLTGLVDLEVGLL